MGRVVCFLSLPLPFRSEMIYAINPYSTLPMSRHLEIFRSRKFVYTSSTSIAPVYNWLLPYVCAPLPRCGFLHFRIRSIVLPFRPMVKPCCAVKNPGPLDAKTDARGSVYLLFVFQVSIAGWQPFLQAYWWLWTSSNKYWRLWLPALLLKEILQEIVSAYRNGIWELRMICACSVRRNQAEALFSCRWYLLLRLFIQQKRFTLHMSAYHSPCLGALCYF